MIGTSGRDGQRSLLKSLIAAGGLIAVVAGCSGQSSTIVVVPACPLAQPGVALTMTVSPACTLERTDTAGDRNPNGLWGEFACVPGQVAWDPAGGDGEPIATGAPQGNSAFRRLTVRDGGNSDPYGERCELGKNSYVDGIAGPKNPAGTFYIYGEGVRRATYVSLRLPRSFPIGTGQWQNVIQLEQAGPSNGSSGTPMLSLKIFGNRFRLFHTSTDSEGPDTQSWSPSPSVNPDAFPENHVWYRIVIDALFSQAPNKGWVKMYIDLNGDGDFSDPEEQSPVFKGATLKTEPAPGPGNSDIPGDGADIGPPTGAPIPSRLGIGIYHNPGIPCPRGCALDVDNVQVIGPGQGD